MTLRMEKSDKIHMYLQAANLDICFMNMKICIAIFARNTPNSDILPFLHKNDALLQGPFFMQHIYLAEFLKIYLKMQQNIRTESWR